MITYTYTHCTTFTFVKLFTTSLVRAFFFFLFFEKYSHEEFPWNENGLNENTHVVTLRNG